MKRSSCIIAFAILIHTANAQTKIRSWISSTATASWQTEKIMSSGVGKPDAEIDLTHPLQTIDGFGTCFNELGWTSLSLLSAQDREKIFRELYAPAVGAGFTICRMPVGANDFSRNWYSYDERDGDFSLVGFTIANDKQTLIPFIKSALKYNPKLQLWASPWSPPTWMKTNKHYAMQPFPKMDLPKEAEEKWGMSFKGRDNGLLPGQEGVEGRDHFIQRENYFKAYALYFRKFIEAYRKEGIRIGMVMPQNEFNSAQVFPSCTWTAAGMAKFVSYLGPEMKQIGVDVFFGTMERPNAKLVDTVLNDPQSGPWIKGVGFQWAGKDAIASIHERYPALKLIQSEQECGNGKNDWDYCKYTWGLMKHYLGNGASAYMYWNTSLKDGGISTWGWKQNSLISVDTVKHTFKYNYEYYLMKHLSHFVKPGAKRLTVNGAFSNLLAFVNPDKSVVIVAQNESDDERIVSFKVGKDVFGIRLKGDSFNTLVIK